VNYFNISGFRKGESLPPIGDTIRDYVFIDDSSLKLPVTSHVTPANSSPLLLMTQGRYPANNS
jgi:hypothetical protein